MEYINKAELKKQLKEETANEFPPFNLVTSYIKVVENMPTIEVVHCMDCRCADDKAFTLDGERLYFCENHCEYVAPNYFCADGERKE